MKTRVPTPMYMRTVFPKLDHPNLVDQTLDPAARTTAARWGNGGARRAVSQRRAARRDRWPARCNSAGTPSAHGAPRRSCSTRSRRSQSTGPPIAVRCDATLPPPQWPASHPTNSPPATQSDRSAQWSTTSAPTPRGPSHRVRTRQRQTVFHFASLFRDGSRVLGVAGECTFAPIFGGEVVGGLGHGWSVGIRN